eukprot:CAMPEP_0197866506 /NCGR_PEP_ID=MMETSP1438-20131217/44252_1 /TAXON_ID=1461541 /ORGANISM="Pterosperma sp., Strain CCMP1384" /LENGTH=112 /DNA_ID=CAMNT_0043485077 /DNA_START=570 /DNA_END=905 /DNA_ORIENTATION=-
MGYTSPGTCHLAQCGAPRSPSRAASRSLSLSPLIHEECHNLTTAAMHLRFCEVAGLSSIVVASYALDHRWYNAAVSMQSALLRCAKSSLRMPPGGVIEEVSFMREEGSGWVP